MQILIDLFLTVGKTISFAFEFLVETLEGIVWVITLLAHFTLNIPDYLTWIPTDCLSPLVLVFGVAVTYKILGRD